MSNYCRMILHSIWYFYFINIVVIYHYFTYNHLINQRTSFLIRPVFQSCLDQTNVAVTIRYMIRSSFQIFMIINLYFDYFNFKYVQFHFIIRYKNPVTGTFEEKHAKKPDFPSNVFSDGNSHLYTLGNLLNYYYTNSNKKDPVLSLIRIAFSCYAGQYLQNANRFERGELRQSSKRYDSSNCAS